MGYFNINHDQFKPSSKLKQPSTTPGVVDRLNANLQRLTPTPPPSPTPGAVPSQPQMQVNTPVEEPKKTGMGRVFDLLNKPSEWVQNLMTGGKTYEEAYTDPNTTFYKLNKVSRHATPLMLIPGYHKKADENWQKSIESDTAKKIGGFANRMVLDPLNFIPFEKIAGLIGKGGQALKGAVGLTKLTDKVMDTARTTPFVYKTVEKFNPFFRKPEFGTLMKESEGVTNKRLNELYTLIKDTSKNLSPAQQRRIGKILEGGVDTAAKYEKLAAPLRELTEKIGKEAVDLGILSRKSFNKYRGVYMKHIFEKYLEVAERNGFARRVSPRIGQQFTQMRKGTQGYIQEFAAPTFAGLGSGIKDIEAARFYKKIASDMGVAAQVVKNGRKIVNRIVPEGYAYAPHAITNSKVAKFFKNKALPKSVIEYINKTTEVKKVTGWDNLLNAWKAGKTIYNPAYHIRNILSNQILSDMSTGKGLTQTAMDYVSAVRQYVGKGNQKFVNAAIGSGLIKQKRFGAALDEFLETAEIVEKSKGRQILDLPRKLQTVTEETSKLQVFKSWIEKLAKKAGKSVDDALKDPSIVKEAMNKAEEAIFSPYKLGQFERGITKNVIPFYSFTRQVVPFTAKTLVNNPARIAKYAKVKREVENMSQDEPRPGYAENFVRLPFKNKKGESMYFDPTYILPFSNVFSPLGSDTGSNLPFGLGFNPAFTEVAQQMANKDFYYDQPITKYESEGMSGENLKSRAAHAFRTFSPQFINNAISKIYPAVAGKTDYAGRQRNVGQALLDSVAGIKTQYIGAEKGLMDKYYKTKSNLRSKQNDLKRILNDKSLSESEKQRMIQKILQ